jgi:hypothetical protein
MSGEGLGGRRRVTTLFGEVTVTSSISVRCLTGTGPPENRGQSGHSGSDKIATDRAAELSRVFNPFQESQVVLRQAMCARLPASE